jgi:DHA1 family bicyclomycin/chloramphenicol resistance-like MFS transporter
MLVAGVAPILALLLGAQLATAGWRATFVAQALIGLGLLLWALRCFDESRPASARLAIRGESLLGSLLHLLRQRSVVGFVGCASLNAIGFFAYLACAPSLLMGTYGLSPRAFGWDFALNAVGFIAAYQLNARLPARYGPIEILRGARLPLRAGRPRRRRQRRAAGRYSQTPRHPGARGDARIGDGALRDRATCAGRRCAPCSFQGT